MKIRVQAIGGALPKQCSVNVQKRIKACGGEAVFGWKVNPIGPAGWFYREQHCVWKSPQGELICVTPIYTSVHGQVAVFYTSVHGQVAAMDWPESVEFELDEAVVFGDDNIGMGTYIPPSDHPQLLKAADCMRRGDRALAANDLQGCRYWTEKANAAIRAAGGKYYFPIPESLDPGHIIEASLPARPS